MGADEQREGEREEQAARMNPRSFTDIICVPVFIGALCALCFVLHYAHRHGDVRRVYHGLDFSNRLCGVSAGVETKPLLYWCTKGGDKMDTSLLENTKLSASLVKHYWGDDGVSPVDSILESSGELDLGHPICVESCPRNRSTLSSCFQEETFVDGEVDITGSFTRKTSYKFSFVQDHPTFNAAGSYCLPSEGKMVQQLSDSLNWGAEVAMFHGAQVFDAWHILVGASLVAFFLGYLYLFLIQKVAGPLIYGTFALSTMAALGAGSYVLVTLHAAKIDDLVDKQFDVEADIASLHVFSTGHRKADLVIGIALIVVGIIIPVVGCCCRKSIELVLGSLEATLECLQDMPLLFLQPVVAVAFRSVFYTTAFVGLSWVVSIGDVANYDLSPYVPRGVVRTFSFDEDEFPLLVAYVFVSIWILTLLAALEQFAFCYATQAWFFSPYIHGNKTVSQFAFFRGLCYGLTYHFGTLVFGSLLLAIFQTLYYVMRYFAQQLQGDDEDKNSVAVGLLACCMCCLKCWQNVIQYLNKNIYLVVIIQSTDFCTSAGTVVSIVANEFKALALLEGITKVFQIGGIISITSVSGWLTWLLVHHHKAYTDPESDFYVPQPQIVAAAAALFACAVAVVFMNVVDVVSDTILMSWAIDRKYRKEHGLGYNDHLPKRLKALLEEALPKERLME